MTTRNSPPRWAATVTSTQKTLIAAAAAVIGASGVLITVPAPAQADPCSQWGFPNGGNGFDTGWGSSLLFQAAGKTVTQTAASWTAAPGNGSSGYLNGSFPGTGVSFTWKGDGGPPNFTGGATITFAGTVDFDGSAHGTAMKGAESTTFTSQNKLACLDAPAASAPIPHAPGVRHTGASPGTATVNADTDLYDKPNDNGDAQIIGQLNSGQVVKTRRECSPDAWCKLTDPDGFAWGRDLTNN